MNLTRRSVLAAGVAAGASTVLARATATATAAGDRPTAFTHATVIDPAGRRTIHDATVVVRGDRIESVGPYSGIPAGATVVDLRGRYLIPGLADMHVHCWFEQIEPPLFLANGVTTVRELSGTPTVHEWRQRIEAGTLAGPRWTIGSVIVDGTPSLWDPNLLPVVQVADATQARAAVRRQLAEGADFVKVYSRLSRPAFHAIAAECGRHGARLVGHCPDSVTVAEAADLGMGSVEHLFGLFYATSTREAALRERLARVQLELGDYNGWFNQCHPIEYDAMRTHGRIRTRLLFDRLARRRTRVVPTLTMHRGLDLARTLDRSDPRRRYLPAPMLASVDHALAELYLKGRDPSLDARWAELFEARLALVGELHRAGVPLMVGTDLATCGVYPGFSVHDELALFADAGLSPMDALRAATTEPAAYLGTRSGGVARGHVADLVVLDADPLRDIRNTRRVAGVLARGTYYDRAARDQLLADVERAAAGITGAAVAPACACHAVPA